TERQAARGRSAVSRHLLRAGPESFGSHRCLSLLPWRRRPILYCRNTVARRGAALFVMIQLYLFREKQRQVEPTTQAAQRLSDDDLRSLSDMVAKLPPPKPPEEPVDAARIEAAGYLARNKHCLFSHNRD